MKKGRILLFIIALCSACNNSNQPKSVGLDPVVVPVKYVTELKIYEPAAVRDSNLLVYFDYDEALLASRKLKKPVMVYFSGINGINCRKMELQVWQIPAVASTIKSDFILVTLYCDANRITLPKDQQYFSKDLNLTVTTLGNKCSDLEASKFDANVQPIYFFVDEKGNKLIDSGYGYSPDVQKFLAHLGAVKEAYRKSVH